MSEKMIEIGGLWLNESKDGKTKYMAGYLGSAKILIFKNDYKEEDKHPDYRMFVAPNEKKQAANDSEESDDVPF